MVDPSWQKAKADRSRKAAHSQRCCHSRGPGAGGRIAGEPKGKKLRGIAAGQTKRVSPQRLEASSR